jgi:hypothetical protein
VKHSGVGFPNGPVDNADVFALPSPELLMLSTEARYHYDAAVRAGKRCVWRAIPRIGKRPAELGWSPARFVAETINLTDAPGEPITDFIPWNELDLSGERGDGADDWSNLSQRYALIGGWAMSVVQSLKQWSPGTRIHWGAWTPDHDALGHIGAWGPAADLCDVIDFHAYDTLENIQRQYGEYRGAFPSKPLMLTEWHCKGDLDEERRVLAWLAETMAADPLFEAAHFFIWRWHNAPGWWSDAWDIEHNPDRLALFRDPPTVAEPEEPEMPTYRVPAWTPAYEDIRDGAIQVADEFFIPRRRLLGLCLGESGFGLQSFDRWASIERSARMVAAINQSDWSRVEAIFSEISGKTNDISFGPCHQSWWWSLSYTEQQAHPEWQWDLTRIMEFRAHLIEDHGAALRLAAGKVTGSGSDLDILCLYNKPSTPPAANPNRPNYERSLAEADRILAGLYPQEPTDPVEPTSTQYEAYPDPQPAGTLGACAGVILHGSRSGRVGNPLANEGKGTASYEVNNSLGLGWNATAWPGHVAIHLPADQWGWNARNASDNYVAIEIAQPVESDPIGNVHIAVADYIFDHVWPRWGEVWHFPSHAELEDWGETGANDGKTDLYHTGAAEMNAFRDKVYARLNERKAGSQPKPEPVPPDYATLTALAYKEDGVVVPALAAALANPDDANLRIQTDSVLRWLRENAPKPAA